MLIWSPKDPGSTEKFAFDFTDRLGADAIVGSPSVTGNGVTVTGATVNGTKVEFELSGGTAGSVATVDCTVATSGGETLPELGVLEIGGEAVSLATAKAQQKLEGGDEDALLGGFLRAAIGHVEKRTGKKLTPKIVGQKAAGFPRARFHRDHHFGSPVHAACGGSIGIRLNAGPVSQILSVDYDDLDGVTQPLTSFRLVEGEDAQLLPAYGEQWPAAQRGPGTVRIVYVAGYDPTELPPALTLAAVLLFGHFNANREAVLADTRAAAVELPLGVEALIDPYCPPGIA